MDLGKVQLGSVVPLAMFIVYSRLICHELVQYFKVATFPFKDDCTAAHVLRSSATHFSIVIQDYTYLKKGSTGTVAHMRKLILLSEPMTLLQRNETSTAVVIISQSVKSPCLVFTSIHPS